MDSFDSPTDSYVLDGVFSHPSPGAQVLCGGGAFIITGGPDVLPFAPERASFTLLVAGLVAWLRCGGGCGAREQRNARG